MGSHDDDDNLTPSDEVTEHSTEHSADTVEHYLRLHEHIEQLRQDKRPHQPGKITPEDARTYQAAALFRAATPGADEPDPAFIASLRERLEREMAAPPATKALRSARGHVTRRGLITGGLGAAAAAAIGVAVGATLPHPASPPPSASAPSWPALVPEGNGAWLVVATIGEIPLGGVKRFVTDTVVGFVRHTNAGYIALSGACTHMGCLLSWNAGARTFDCPCHGGRFTENGTASPDSPIAYRPLPTMQTKLEGGNVWVFVAATPDSATVPTPGNKSNGYGNP
ncbi:MAG: ubiquinol-cytochrome c reductase iron-sulfur subunit [Nitrososphaerota archaeon]